MSAGPRRSGPRGPAGAARPLSDSRRALARHVVTINAPTLGDFIVSLDGQRSRQLRVGPAGPVLHTAEVFRGANGQPRRQPTVDTRFRKLSLMAQLLHTAASPSVAYLLLVIGLLLLVLEFFTARVGIAALCGAGCLAAGVLRLRGVCRSAPTPWSWSPSGSSGSPSTCKRGTPRVWTAIGMVTLVVGTVRLYHGVHLSPLAMIAGVVGHRLFMVAGMPAMVRARFSTPTIGRESMIGEMGTALAAIEPEGTVEVRGAPWRARTNRATPDRRGASIRVVAIDGLLLEVEPETGGARDARH